MAMTPKMVTIDCADPQRLATFWTEAAHYRVANDFGVFVMLIPAAGEGLAIGLQKVPETRVAKNRVHVDWHTPDRPAEVERLAKLGATVLGEETAPGLAWTVLADPEGNEFCVAG
jgi:predicted enzyme related to lactoylglutathione lyase